MENIYQFDSLEKLLSSLYLITGRKVTLKSQKFDDVITSSTACNFCRLIQKTDYGYKRCLDCDANALAQARQQNKAYLYRCHAGLMEAAVPIMENGRPIAYLMYGQVLDETPIQEQWARIERQCGWHNDLPALKQEFLKLDRLSYKKLMAYADILSACASYIWLQKYVQQSEPSCGQQLLTYVQENYTRPLTLEMVAAELGVGKTKLCKVARDELFCSVQQLIRRQRMKEAARLLQHTDRPVCQVAEAVGINDSNYFSKIFKDYTGLTPLHYRRLHAKPHSEQEGFYRDNHT